MRSIVTGGCGFIGTNLTNFFLKKKYKVVVIDTQWFGNYLPKHKNLKVIKKDLRAINDPLELLADALLDNERLRRKITKCKCN